MSRLLMAAALWGGALVCGGCSKSVEPAPIDKAKEPKMPDKEELAQRVRPLDDYYAKMILAEHTRLKELPTPFFGKGTVCRVTRMLPTRPVVFTVGCADELTVLLAGNPAGFITLAGKAQLQLDTQQQRTAYVTTFLETTRSFADRFQIVGNVDEIKPRPNLSDEDQERFGEIQEKYRSLVAPLRFSGPDGWECIVFAVKGQDLVQIDVKLGADGKVETEETVLEAELPVAYGL